MGPFKLANSGKYKALSGSELLFSVETSSLVCMTNLLPSFVGTLYIKMNAWSTLHIVYVAKQCPKLVIYFYKLKIFVNNCFMQGPKYCVTSVETETHFIMISHLWLCREIYHLVAFNLFLLYRIGIMLVLTKHAIRHHLIPFEPKYLLNFLLILLLTHQCSMFVVKNL